MDYVSEYNIDEDKEEVSLTNCDRENIHIPSAIQSHGILWEINLNGQVIRISQNVEKILGWKVEEVFFHSIVEFFKDEDWSKEFQTKLQSHFSLTKINPVKILFKKSDQSVIELDTVFYANPQSIVMEAEISESIIDPIEDNQTATVLKIFDSIHSVKNISTLHDYIAKHIREITDYDRVMVYKFDNNWNGEVVGEAKKPELAPFLGLNYPASDIPLQARKLYTRNLIRIIPNVNYEPVPIISHPIMGNTILDQSDSVLRAVSPMHIEYLKNMGVTSTLTISILLNGKLWGLIACHHYSERYITLSKRYTCRMLVHFFALQIGSLTKQEMDSNLLFKARIQNKLIDQMGEDQDFINGLVNGAYTILDFMDCDGAAIVLGDRIELLGETPDKFWINLLTKEIDLFDIHKPFFSTSSLTQINSKWEIIRPLASGVLIVQVPSTIQFSIIWFRKEHIYTKVWSGDPHKPKERQDVIADIHPRKSFEAWEEEVKNSSRPWKVLEIQAALELRNAIAGRVINRTNEISKLFAELDLVRKNEERAINALHEKEVLIKEVHHRVKNNLQIIISLLSLQSHHTKDPTIINALQESQNRIKSMSIVHELLYMNENLSLININNYVQALLYNLRESQKGSYTNITMLNEIGDFLISVDMAIPCGLIINELVTNSYKYAFQNVRSPVLKITFKDSEQNYILEVKDNGVGYPANMTFDNFTSLGLLLVQSLSRQIGAKLDFYNENGAVTLISIPK
ncbi:histidine kinase dimerization/phosphoacceptor domain -containing protein [Leptospira sp. GIMC2001]|uniref:histidine kinase dimerization/phosphoacceptor domain -containing protein n=1 Tax=Leptospira sp. GIMC2001 TaxID=1513297 RepID=UPI00234A1231|nr:histidine kinase dimerization/phosphoacceptor domain -containing protein [Leptospira sp. GIMC2001]WCL48759.1 GAF domain-containing protein [Leptospira sp. GIMC2001]